MITEAEGEEDLTKERRERREGGRQMAGRRLVVPCCFSALVRASIRPHPH